MNAVVLVLAMLEVEEHWRNVADTWPCSTSESRSLRLCMVRTFGYAMGVAI